MLKQMLIEKGVHPDLAAHFIASTTTPAPAQAPPTGGPAPKLKIPPGGIWGPQGKPPQNPLLPPGAVAAGVGTPQIDWKMYLADWGFDADVIKELDRIFKVYSDPAQASAAALAYIRGTDWYKKTFAGIGYGLKNNLFSDEAGYRGYVNDLNQYYRRYFGRDATTNEIIDSLGKGLTSGQVGQHLTGQAYVNANKEDIQYALGAFGDTGRATDAELTGYGDQIGGLSNTMGTQVDLKLAKARQRLQTIFTGQLGTPALTIAGGGGLATSSFGRAKPDIGA